MKAKKELTHGELMATLFEHLNFPMSPPDLKKRIEHLIDRDFIERDPESANRYRYLAWAHNIFDDPFFAAFFIQTKKNIWKFTYHTTKDGSLFRVKWTLHRKESILRNTLLSKKHCYMFRYFQTNSQQTNWSTKHIVYIIIFRLCWNKQKKVKK